jgi:hypothetical protein
MAEESKIYLGRLVQNKFWTPESKIYLGRLVQNKLVYNDERSAWECLLGRGASSCEKLSTTTSQFALLSFTFNKISPLVEMTKR